MIDITTRIKQQSNNLFVGQLILGSNFELIDAMSCIEIMHPKMDSNLNHAQPPSTPPDFNQKDTADLIDNLLALEYMYIDGNLLSQTIYTCQFFHYPHSKLALDNAVLESSDLFIHLANSIIKGANIWHEEDWTPDAEGLPQNRTFNCSTHYSNLVRLAKEHADDPAMLSRIEFRIHWIDMLKFVELRDFESAGQSFIKMKAKFRGLMESVGESNNASKYFDYKLTLKTFTHTAPRPPLDCNIKARLEQFQQMINDLDIIFDFCENTDDTTIDDLQLFLHYFSNRRPEANTLVRSILAMIIVNDDKLFDKRPLGHHVKDSIKKLTTAPTMSSKNDQISKIITSTTDALGHPFINYLTLSCRNSARNSRNLVKLIRMFEQFQFEAERIDADLGELAGTNNANSTERSLGVRYDLSSWIYHWKLGMIASMYERGFALGLYELHEFGMMTWYLVYIHEMQLQHYNLIAAHGASHKQSIQLIAAKREIRKSLLCLISLLEFRKPSSVLFCTRTNFEHRFRFVGGLGSPLPLSFDKFEEDMKEKSKDSVSFLGA